MQFSWSVPFTVLVFAASQFVYAQNALEEVVVTARKKEENLQEIPVAVTAFGAEALKEAGMENLADFSKTVPGMDVAGASGNAPLANIFIRGVGQRNTGPNIDSGVGIYLDGIYLARPDGALLDIADISSVQVLRGPQGTLFGKNTTGGAAVFTTNRPSDDFEFKISGTAGERAMRTVEGMVNVPLIDDKAAARIAFIAKEQDGYVHNAFDGRDYMNTDRDAVLVKLRYDVSDAVSLMWINDYSTVDQLARPQKCTVIPGRPGWLAELLDALVVTPATGRKYIDFCQDAQDAGGGDLDVVLSDLDRGRYESTIMGSSLQLSWDINETMNFKSITAWRNTEAAQDDELDHTAFPHIHRTQNQHHASKPRDTDQWTQELQLTGELFDAQVEYITGMYFFTEETLGAQNVSFVASPTIISQNPSATTFFLNSNSGSLETKNTAAAIFAQADWAMAEQWRLIAGLRYTWEKREVDRTARQPDPDSINNGSGTLTFSRSGIYQYAGEFIFNENFTFMEVGREYARVIKDAVTPMLSMQYIFEDSGFVNGGNVYATISRGFQSGGISEDPNGLAEFKPEIVNNIELGTKLDMWNRRLRINSSIFHSEYIDRQLTTVVINPRTNNPAGATINAEESTISGIEIETTLIPFDNAFIMFNAAWSKGEIKKFEDTRVLYERLAAEPDQPAPFPNCEERAIGGGAVIVNDCRYDRSDEDLPRLAKRSAYLAFQYNFHTEWGTFSPRIDGSWRYGMEFCFDAGSCESGIFRTPRAEQYGFHLGWVSPKGNYTASIFGRNITDSRFTEGGTALVDSVGSGGRALNAPATWGGSLTYTY